MSRLLGFLGLTVGSWIGWSVGGRMSLTAAIFLSVLGSGIGLYLGRRIVQEYF